MSHEVDSYAPPSSHRELRAGHDSAALSSITMMFSIDAE
jgi:hypothetical protein